MPATASVFLNVQSLEKSLEWYRNLGFKVLKSHKNDAGKVAWADLALDGAELGLGEISSNDDPGYRQWVSTPLGAGVIVYFTVPDVQKTYKAAQKMRATIEFPLTERSYGTTFTANDPDGYTISFLTEAKAPKKAKAKTAKRK